MVSGGSQVDETPLFLITGGSRGIGKAIALQAADAGHAVLLSYVSNQEAAEGLVKEILARGGRAWALQADTAKEADIQRLFAECDRLGRLEALVYNSGITGPSSPLLEASTATLARVLEVNVLGAMICAREAVRRMSTLQGGRGGSIVLISSRVTSYGAPGDYVWYAASKGAIDSLTTGLAREVAREGIRVNAVSPGFINTGIHAPGKLETVVPNVPMQRAGEPAEVAAAVMFLVSSQASYINGANLAVGGGR
jgi:NAD(P)-dependent dehydrogenase (short-subunit alcohol dehydrogenase family)